MVTSILVTHAAGSYPVYIAPGLLGRIGPLAEQHLADRKLALVTDDTVLALLDAYRSDPGSVWRKPNAPVALPAFGTELSVPAGEASKTRERWIALSDALLERGFGRDSGIVAVGGGVVGDLGGFVAATYLRGIPYLQVPTTLLAMLDASVGGKTGVDTARGKNLIGAFHPPAAVVADMRTLLSLPEREFVAGLAEAVKHGLIADRAYFTWIRESADRIRSRDLETLAELVRGSVAIKATVVGEDEREAGRRAVLNAGHTVAHALEHVSGYALAHGEAVALGLVAECRLAEALGVGRAGLAAEVSELLAQLGLPTRLAQPLAAEQVKAAMALDKKNRQATVRFSLPADVGTMFPGQGWTVAAPNGEVEAALAAIQ